MRLVAVLFARSDSIYKQMPFCDVWDKERDARNWKGLAPIVAPPPCRSWGQLSHFAKPEPGEKQLAPYAIELIQKNGGVLEHPRGSKLWQYCNLPAPGKRDKHGAFTLPIDQDWFGHKAEKRTMLYILGLEPNQLPTFPIRLEEPEYVVAPGHGLRAGMPGYRKQLGKADREHTPPLLAQWLVDIARATSL